MHVRSSFSFVLFQSAKLNTKISTLIFFMGLINYVFSLHCRSESQTIQSIVGLISRSLSCEFIELTEDFVGIETRVVELESILAVGLDDVRFIGVWAMGGMGKTTLASVVYSLISEEFEASFFVNVREDCEKDGLLSLQKKLLCQILKETNLNIDNINQGAVMIRNRLRYRRILVVLDDVNHLKQLDMLARKPSWFGPGSRDRKSVV